MKVFSVPENLFNTLAVELFTLERGYFHVLWVAHIVILLKWEGIQKAYCRSLQGQNTTPMVQA